MIHFFWLVYTVALIAFIGVYGAFVALLCIFSMLKWAYYRGWI